MNRFFRTGEFRAPKDGEWFEGKNGEPIKHYSDCFNCKIDIGPRWILRAEEDGRITPTKEWLKEGEFLAAVRSLRNAVKSKGGFGKAFEDAVVNAAKFEIDSQMLTGYIATLEVERETEKIKISEFRAAVRSLVETIKNNKQSLYYDDGKGPERVSAALAEVEKRL
jgi:hypothetical protein